MFAPVRKALKQLSHFIKKWNTNLSLVILCSDEKLGFEPREVWGIEYNKTLWDILLFIETNNRKALIEGNAHLFEYIICENLPIKYIPEYTLEEFYSYMFQLNRDCIESEDNPIDHYAEAKAQIRSISKKESIKGMTIE